MNSPVNYHKYICLTPHAKCFIYVSRFPSPLAVPHHNFEQIHNFFCYLLARICFFSHLVLTLQQQIPPRFP